MATSSIQKTFIVSGQEQVEKFADAIEKSYQESLTNLEREPVKYKELHGPEEITQFMERWKKAHES